MKGHLFEEELKQLHIVLNHINRVAKKVAKSGDVDIVTKHEIIKSAIALDSTIADLEINILDYEKGIDEDIDKVKADILQALKRL